MIHALVAATVPFMDGERGVQQLLRSLGEGIGLLGASSAYRRGQQSPRRFESPIEFVLEIETDRELRSLPIFLRGLCGRLSLTGDSRRLELLLAGDDVMMTPDLTLPHPSFHADPLLIRCAAELSPDLLHPVLGRTLGDLARMVQAPNEIEFWRQGQRLVDFSLSES